MSMIERELEDRPELHLLTPIKRNDTRIRNNDMLSFDHVMEGFGEPVACRKKVLRGGRCLYSIFAADKHAREDVGKLFPDKLLKSGVIVLESDLDTEPALIYRCYADRWLLELVFKAYRTFERLDPTREQSDFSVTGSEFINFVAATITCRMLNKAYDANLLEHLSFARLLHQLDTAWRLIDSPRDPRRDDGAWVHTFLHAHEQMEAFGLSTPPPKPAPRRRGRPPKKKRTTCLEVPGPKATDPSSTALSLEMDASWSSSCL